MYSVGKKRKLPSASRIPNLRHIGTSLLDLTSLPLVDSIKSIHLYEFDGTLLRTPEPNPEIWFKAGKVLLESPDKLLCGGWWTDPAYLQGLLQDLTARNCQAETDAYFNLPLVQLAAESIQDPDCLAVLVCGRAVEDFSGVVTELLQLQGLNFDAIFLPLEGHTGNRLMADRERVLAKSYKLQLISELAAYYSQATQMAMYFHAVDDSIDEMHGLMKAVRELRGTQSAPLNYSLTPVFCLSKKLPPALERQLVVQQTRRHNEMVWHSTRSLKHMVSMLVHPQQVGHYLDMSSRKTLLAGLQSYLPTFSNDSDPLRYLANRVMLRQATSTPTGLQTKPMEWIATHVGSFNDKVWAARVTPVDNASENVSENGLGRENGVDNEIENTSENASTGNAPLATNYCIVLVQANSASLGLVDQIASWDPLPEPLIHVHSIYTHSNQIRMKMRKGN